MSIDEQLRRTRGRLVAAILVVLATIVPSDAITVAPLSFEELVKHSSTIVYGRVVAVEGQWTDDRQRIESVITIDVLKGLKGTSPASLSLVIPGGQAGRYVNILPGAPSFARGDLAVMFLTSRGARLPITTGFTQGIYRVSTASGQALVVPPVLDAPGVRVARGDARRKPVTLDAFEATVRAVR